MDPKDVKKYEIVAVVLLLVILGGLAAWYLNRPQGLVIEPSAGQAAFARESGVPLTFTNSLGMEFVLIPPGSYSMGSPESEEGRAANEGPLPVSLTEPFHMQTTEVTQGQFEEVMNDNPSTYKGFTNNPVESVTWKKAILFCNVLSKKEGLDHVYVWDGGIWTPDYAKNGYRLPREAEWEYACRAGTDTATYAGSHRPAHKGIKNLGYIAWYKGNADGRVRQVGALTPNAFGLHDMLGNVWEWCWDAYDEELHKREGLEGPTSSPEGRVKRGGSVFSKLDECRAATRKAHYPSQPSKTVGFRMVRGL